MECRKPFFRMGTVFVLTFVMVQVVYAQFSRAPRNDVLTTRGTAQFACTGENLGWDKYAPGEDKPLSISIYKNMTGPTRYQVNTDEGGSYILVFYVSTLETAGRYRCKYVPLPTLYREAELIVLESHPTCVTNTTSQYFVLEGEYVKYSCVVKYAGKWAPVLTLWKVNERAAGVKNESHGNTVKFSIDMKITHSDNISQLSCECKFDQPRPGTTSKYAASNVPSYNHWCRMTSITLCYGPKNIAVTPEHKAYKPGTTIQVTADSVPPLGSYKWVDTTKNTSVGTGNSFIITSNMVGRASLKVVLCNTMPIPPVYDVCCEVTLSFEVGSDVNEADKAGSPITKTTCGTRGTRPSRTLGTSPSTTPTTTQRTSSVSTSVGSTKRSTNYPTDTPASTVFPVTRATISTLRRRPTSSSTRTNVSVKSTFSHTSNVSPITNKAVGQSTDATTTTATVTSPSQRPTSSMSTPRHEVNGQATDRTILIIGGAILLCVTLLAIVSIVTTIVLCVRMRRVMTRLNDLNDKVYNRPESAPPLNTQVLHQRPSSSTQDVQGPPQDYETAKPYDSYQGLYATIPEGGQPV